MSDLDPHHTRSVIAQIRHFATTENFRLTQHAHQEMVEEAISLDKVLQTLVDGNIIENYPDHQRGACCLVYGSTQNARPLHVVCTTSVPILNIITV